MAHVRTDAREGVRVEGRTPYGWGDDRLATFLNLASDNMLGTFAQLRSEYDRLRQIDDAFVDFTENLLNPPDPVAPLLMLQAHASYRAATELAMTCQSAPAFMAMRGCVESSLYGLYFHRNPNTFEIWVRRHDDDAARQAVRVEFTIRRLKDCLAVLDPATADSVADLYDKTIDSEEGCAEIVEKLAAMQTGPSHRTSTAQRAQRAHDSATSHVESALMSVGLQKRLGRGHKIGHNSRSLKTAVPVTY